MNDMIVRFDGFGKVDRCRTHEITPDKTFDNKRLDREKLKELIDANDPVINWLEHGLKYDSLRGVAYDSMIKGQANGKAGYYLFMKNTFKGTGIPLNLDTQGVNNGQQ